jgi:hypothetical protein
MLSILLYIRILLRYVIDITTENADFRTKHYLADRTALDPQESGDHHQAQAHYTKSTTAATLRANDEDLGLILNINVLDAKRPCTSAVVRLVLSIVINDESPSRRGLP